MNNIERFETVYFELYSKELGRVEIPEPKGWSEDFLGFEKDKDSKDIRKKVEIDLEFYNESSDYLATLYYTYGILPTALIIKYEKSTEGLEETWDLAYVQRIDLKTFSMNRESGQVKVKAYEGGLYELIKNRYDDEIDILNEYSLDGEYIGPLKTYPFQASERKIFLQSLLEGDYDRYRIGTGYWDSEFRSNMRPIPFEIKYKSDGAGDIQKPNAAELIYNEGRAASPFGANYAEEPVELDMPLFFEAEEYKELNISLNLQFKIAEFEERYVDGTPDLAVRYIKSYRGPDGIQLLKEKEDILVIENMFSNVGVIHNVLWNKSVTLEEGESISLVFATYVRIDSSAAPFTNGYANTWINSKATIVIQDTTQYAPVIGRAVKPKDLFDRLVAKITGISGLVKSEVFGEGGEFEFKMIDNGFFARGFPDKYKGKDGEDIAIQFNTSFKEAYEAFSGITPMCWFTQKEGNKEVVRVEPELYALSNFIGIVFDSADDIHEDCSPNDQFSKIILGHEGELVYEEVNGLDEPNGKATFATHLGKSTNNEYLKLSPYNFDAMRYELTRRVRFERFPYEDTEGDENIWIHDAKQQGDMIVHRSWQDDFIAPPKGIFDPDSAWNLRHSPMNLLYRGHGYAVRRCLYHDTEKYIRFSASNANQNLVTFPKEGVVLKENGELQINKLQKQRIKADKITMVVKVTSEIRKQLEGVNDRGVKNVFGLVQYPENGVKKYGRIVKLSSGESSKLELIKAGI